MNKFTPCQAPNGMYRLVEFVESSGHLYTKIEDCPTLEEATARAREHSPFPEGDTTRQINSEVIFVAVYNDRGSCKFFGCYRFFP